MIQHCPDDSDQAFAERYVGAETNGECLFGEETGKKDPVMFIKNFVPVQIRQRGAGWQFPSHNPQMICDSPKHPEACAAIMGQICEHVGGYHDPGAPAAPHEYHTTDVYRAYYCVFDMSQ